jgi:hypothetical protein
VSIYRDERYIDGGLRSTLDDALEAMRHLALQNFLQDQELLVRE